MHEKFATPAALAAWHELPRHAEQSIVGSSRKLRGFSDTSTCALCQASLSLRGQLAILEDADDATDGRITEESHIADTVGSFGYVQKLRCRKSQANEGKPPK
jgi:hypothetical protein